MLLSKKLPHQLFPCFFRHRLLLDARHHFSTTAVIASRNPSPAPSRAAAAQPHFLVSYLVESCGFSKREAAEVSKPVLARIKSTENPDAVLAFLREQGFTKNHIRKVVSGEPSVLCASVSESLEPKIRALKDAGFCGSDIPVLFSTKPLAFRVFDLVDKVHFWTILFDSKERLFRFILSSRNTIFSSLDKKMKPNVSLLREYMESQHRVTKMISRKPQLLGSSTDSLRKVMKRVESLGISRDSRLFDKALYVLLDNSVKTFDAKFELLKSFGWSESEFHSAIQKSPSFLGSSKKKVQSIMEFLLKEVGCEPSYVAMHPTMLTLSLERRLMPRYRVVRVLASNGLTGEGYDFYNVLCMTEKDFLKRYIFRHGEKAPELYQSYVAACTRGNPS